MTDYKRVDVGLVLKRLGIDATKKGKEWYALCPNPNHADSKPSFRVRDDVGSEKNGHWKCFPCNWGGGLAELVRWRLGLDDQGAARAWIFSDAAAELAVQAHDVESKIELAPQLPRFSLRLPPEGCFDPFDRWPGPPANYWSVKRALLPMQVGRWGVGYAASGRLGGRIIIPSRDALGRPLSYTARDFTERSEIRYMQPMPTERARVTAMFGEQHWPSPEDREWCTLLVVEGEINGLAAEAECPGIYFGATAGSSLREMHGAKIAGWGRVVVMTDPDDAGDALHEDVVRACARSEAVVARLRLSEDGEVNDAAKLRVKRPGALLAMLREYVGG